MEKIKVEVEKYKAKDGEIFDTEAKCILHEKFIDGIAKTCPNCNGEKKVDAYGDGRVFSTCQQCKGKGYIEKVVKWE